MAGSTDVSVDTANWSGEGLFTQAVIDGLRLLDGIAFVRVEDAPASRSEADYNFVSNEVYVRFSVAVHTERVKRFGFLPASIEKAEKRLSMASLEEALARVPEIGAPDYSDERMLQYLRTERVIPPYQTRGYKIIELVRIYEVDAPPR